LSRCFGTAEEHTDGVSENEWPDKVLLHVTFRKTQMYTILVAMPTALRGHGVRCKSRICH